jgi:uncharacterized coiled-coil DUF342 family protein
LEIILAALASSGMFSLIQFLIKRHDDKNGKRAELDKKIDSIRKDIDDLRAEIKKSDALQARRRILRFNDELLSGLKHSKEAFDDIIEEDLDLYDKFTKTHPDFINNKCTLAAQHIKDTYLKCEREASFL